MGKEHKNEEKAAKKANKERKNSKKNIKFPEADSFFYIPKAQIQQEQKAEQLKFDKKKAPSIILKAASSIYVEDIDLKFYTEMVAQSRVLSACLVDKYGRFIYYDKRARQHFQGSLNNLKARSLFDLMIPQSRVKLVQIFSGSFREVVFKYTLYSKNTKRKYLKKDTNKTEADRIEDIYFRYLKSLSSRIRPIILNYTGIDFPGDWTQTPGNQKVQCFLIQTRPSLRSQKLDQIILEDETIKKFERQALKKRSTKEMQDTEKVNAQDGVMLIDMKNEEDKQNDIVGSYLISDKYILE